MGSSQSSNRMSYRRISDSKTVPLLQNQNQFMEIDYAVQEYYKELQGLKKEVGSLKSNLCSLETEIHTTKPIYELGSTSRTKATEVYDEQEAITNVEKKVEKLKKNLDDVILGREAQKIIHSAEISKQGEAIQNINQKAINLEKKIGEIESKVNEISSTLDDMAALISQINHPKPQIHTHQQQALNQKSSTFEEAPELRQASITDITIKLSEDEINFVEKDYAVEEYSKELQGLKKDIGSLKSNFCRLQTDIHTSKHIYELGRSAPKIKGISKIGEAIQNIHQENMDLEKKIGEMERKMNEISSTLVDMAAAPISEINHQSSKEQVMSDISCTFEEVPEVRKASITDITIKLSEDEINVCLIILIFLLSFFIGFNV